MNTIDDPFDYPPPFKPPKTEEEQESLREKRRQKRAEKLGRPVGKHGGYRKGAGRPRQREWSHRVYINVDNIQVKLLEDLGGGDINDGIQILIERHTNG